MHDRIPTAEPVCDKCLGARDTFCREFWDSDDHFDDGAWDSWCATAGEIADSAWINCEILGALIMLRTSTPEFEEAIAAIESTDTIRILGFSLLLLSSFAEEYGVDVSEIFAEIDEEEALAMILAGVFGDEAVLGDSTTEFGVNLI